VQLCPTYTGPLLLASQQAGVTCKLRPSPAPPWPYTAPPWSLIPRSAEPRNRLFSRGLHQAWLIDSEQGTKINLDYLGTRQPSLVSSQLDDVLVPWQETVIACTACCRLSAWARCRMWPGCALLSIYCLNHVSYLFTYLYLCLSIYECRCLNLFKVARGSIVVKAPHCNPEGRGFETQCVNDSYQYTRPWGLLSLWQKWLSQRQKSSFYGVKRWLARKVDNPTAICEPIV
jgi:hypothetical protein